MDAQGKKVLIVGGSKGIGRALALDMARRGADVWVAARGQAALDEVVAALGEAGPGKNHGSVAFDVTDPAAVRAGAETVLAQLGGLDILVCNSGYSQCAAIHDAPDDHFRRLMDVNFFGHVNVVKAFTGHFMAQKSGEIVLVSSILGVFSMWGYGGYSASKHAIHGFASALRQEMMLYGVHVRLYAPGTTDTPGYATENEDKPPLIYAIEEESAFNSKATPEFVAGHMLKWLGGRGFFAYPTWENSLMYHAFRLVPGIARYLADQEVHTAKKKLQAKGEAVPG